MAAEPEVRILSAKELYAEPLGNWVFSTCKEAEREWGVGKMVSRFGGGEAVSVR